MSVGGGGGGGGGGGSSGGDDDDQEGGGGKASRKPYLVIGIPTVPRVKNEDHLLRVMASILDQMPTDQAHPLYGRVEVLVMNCKHDGVHARFEEAKKCMAFASCSCAQTLAFFLCFLCVFFG